MFFYYWKMCAFILKFLLRNENVMLLLLLLLCDIFLLIIIIVFIGRFVVCLGERRIRVSSVVWWIERYLKCKCVRLCSSAANFLVLAFYIKLGDMCKVCTLIWEPVKYQVT